MTERLCLACVYFSPAHTCIERPTWGHCLKRVTPTPGAGAGTGQPRFTWADNHCDDFQMRQPADKRADREQEAKEG